MKTVRKPWGHEQWLTLNEHYCLKLMHMKKGTRTSLQVHSVKRETHYVDSGRIKFTMGPDRDHLVQTIYEAGAVIDILPGMVHRCEALEDSRLIEASTPQVDDVTRLQDDYERPSGRISTEHDQP